MRRTPLLIVALLSLLAPRAGLAASDATVTVRNFAFDPTVTRVTIDRDGGNDIKFVNRDAAPHRMHSGPHGGSNEGGCFETTTIGLNQTSTVAIDYTLECIVSAMTNGPVPEPGTIVISYHCHIHPGMTGTIVVALA